MSYNAGGPSRPSGSSRPLIQRPQTTSVAPTPTPTSNMLGSAVAGALNGMGIGHVGVWNPNMWAAQPGMQQQQQQHPLPNPPYGRAAAAATATAMYPGGNAYAAVTGGGGGGVYNPAFLHRQQPAYPSSFYPPPSYGGYQSMSMPLTTSEGYTLSSSYVPPPLPHRLTENDSGGRPAKKQKTRGSRPQQQQQSSDRPPIQIHASVAAVAQPPRPPPAPAVPREPQLVECCKDDCTFKGSKKQVREHEEDRHLIFAPGREPKPWKGSYNSGAKIEGFGISLDSPEAVAKWIADRKKRWPTNQVVAEKEAQRAERVAAGLERPASVRGRGRGRGRGERGGRGSRGRGGRGTIPTDSRSEAPSAAAVNGVTSVSDSDSGSSTLDSDGSTSDDSDSDDDDEPPTATSAKVEVSGLFDHDGGEVVKLDSEADHAASSSGKMVTHPDRLVASTQGDEGDAMSSKPFQVVCKYWRAGQCALSDDCSYLHTLPSGSEAERRPPPPPPLRKRARPAPRPPPENPFARPSDPFDQLAERDWTHAVSDILQVVDFLAKNDWLRGVEMRAGQVDEESGIEVLQNGGGDDNDVLLDEHTLDSASVVGAEAAAPASEVTEAALALAQEDAQAVEMDAVEAERLSDALPAPDDEQQDCTEAVEVGVTIASGSAVA